MLNKKEHTKPIIVFSAEDENKSKKNNGLATQRLEELLNNMQIPFKKVVGSYNGSLEYSFVTHAQYLPDLRYIVYGLFEQESILHIDKDNKCKLLSDELKDQELGTLHKVSIQHAINDYLAFTISGKNAYIIK